MSLNQSPTQLVIVPATSLKRVCVCVLPVRLPGLDESVPGAPLASVASGYNRRRATRAVLPSVTPTTQPGAAHCMNKVEGLITLPARSGRAVLSGSWMLQCSWLQGLEFSAFSQTLSSFTRVNIAKLTNFLLLASGAFLDAV